MATTADQVDARDGTGRGVSSRGVRAAAVAPPPLPPARHPRRWGRLAAGAVLVLGGGLVTASLFASAGDRVEVLAVANGVAENEAVEAGDLTRVRVGSDGAVATIPASELDAVVGRVAAVDLVPGALLAPSQLRGAGERVVAGDEAIVGLLLSAADAPLSRLASGSPVQVVVRPAAGGGGEVSVIDGWLLDTSAEPLQNGDRPVTVVVPAEQVEVISPAAAEDRVTVAVGES